MLLKRLAAFCAAAALLCLTSSMLVADESLHVFDGTTNAVQLGAWGSGEIKLDEEQTFSERQTLVVATNGYHAGGRLDLKQPVDFTVFGADPVQTQLIILAKAKEPEQSPYGGYGLPGGRGIGTAVVSQPPEPIDRIRVVLVTDKGQLSSGGLLLDPNLTLEGDWVQIRAVLSDFARPEDLQGATLQRVVITGNHEGTVYVADLKIIQEDTPLVADIQGPEIRIVPARQLVQFTVKPQHEGVKASYQWDFDDLNGLGLDGYGENVSYQFPEAGYYVVTLRVTDANGKLQPRMDRVKVKVAYMHETDAAAEMAAPPAEELSGKLVDGIREIRVEAFKFGFEPDPIVVKKGEAVRIIATSGYGTHGFGIEDFNINIELAPGEENIVEFTPAKVGEFQIRCTVYCGVGHGGMHATLVVRE